MQESDTEQTPDDSTVLSAVTKMLEARIPTMSAGLHERYGNEVGEQADRRKFQTDTAENAAWHMGYVTAMNDMLSMIRRRITSYPIQTEPSSAEHARIP